MRPVALLAAILLAFTTVASAQTTFRDASGRITGTVTSDSNGTRTFRDGSGRITGAASTDSKRDDDVSR
jgi:YD repeat-containing protein